MFKKLYYKLFGYKYAETLITLDSIQRSGTHAVSNWLLHQANKNASGVNDLLHISEEVYGCDKDVFVNCANINILEGQMRVVNSNFQSGNNIIFVHEKPWMVDTSVYSMKALKKIHVINIRDPFNTFASCLNGFGTVPSHIIGEWRGLAQKCLKGTDRHVLLYNEWFKSEEYRKDFCKQIGLEFNDLAKNVVPDFGGGSSFEKMGHKKEAEKMNVMNRFKTFQRNRTFCDIFLNNPEIVELSDALFGIIECTENFRK